MNKKLCDYVRSEVFPTPFCSGCGHGILMNTILRCMKQLELDTKELIFVSGIGCAGWIPSPHFAADVVHVTHGRAIPFAVGIKSANPALRVIVISGDGDLASIGGNHLIHAAHRNFDITVICANNQIYGMTGGQTASTTPVGAFTSIAPAGNKEAPLDLCKLVIAAGASYVARYTVFHTKQLERAIKMGLTSNKKGFSFIDCISPCPTEYGRRNRFKTPVDMMKGLKLNCVPMDLSQAMSEKSIGDRIYIGEFSRR